MKKVIIAVAALATLSLVSCKKDWSCSCVSNQPGDVASVQTHKELKKSQAVANCHNYEYEGTDFTTGNKTTVTVTCSLSKK